MEIWSTFCDELREGEEPGSALCWVSWLVGEPGDVSFPTAAGVESVISPRPAATFPTNSLSNGSLVTTVRLADPTDSEEPVRKCSWWSRPRTILRNAPFMKPGAVSAAPFNSLHSGRGLSPYQAQTCRRPQAGSRFLNPASDSAVGVSPRSRRAASSLLTAAFTASRVLNWA